MIKKLTLFFNAIITNAELPVTPKIGDQKKAPSKLQCTIPKPPVKGRFGMGITG